jgi:undecaprenyl-diphosphatase
LNVFSAFDRRVTLAVRNLHAPGRDRVVHAITFLGSQRFLIPAAILLSGALILLHRGPSAKFLGGAMLLGSMWSPLLKRRFRRGRPDLWTPLATEASHSFPSGHATMGTIFFGAAGAVLFREAGSPLARILVAAGAFVVIAAVALSRVYLGAHWLSDVLAGILLGAVWLIVYALVSRAVFPRPLRSEFTACSIPVDAPPLQVAFQTGGRHCDEGTLREIASRLRGDGTLSSALTGRGCSGDARGGIHTARRHA